MLVTTGTRADTAFPYGSWLWGGLAWSFLTTSNTAGADYRAGDDGWLLFQQIIDPDRVTSNTVYEIRQAPAAHTNAGPALLTRAARSDTTLRLDFRARDAIYEMRRLSGLTWEELAALLSVSRRSLHLWANGGTINATNEKHVRDLTMALRALDRGTARENRNLMLAPCERGGTFTDLLRDRRFEQAIALARHWSGRAGSPAISGSTGSPALPKLSVADQMGTSAERVHADDSRALPRRRRARV
jgi:hypothetical protein